MDEESRWLVIPRRLDDPPKFLFWDFDVASIACLGMAFGALSGQFLLGCVGGCLAAYAWSRTKQGKHRGYGLHVAYWNLPVRIFRRTPPSARRDFMG
jgi:conjugal transfer pilus assembly protein TraL